MKLSDLISSAIIDMLDNSVDDFAVIQRNELAETMGCAPSQINYVITSRFTPEHGYTVESHRGGGGYIRIARVKLDHSSAIMHIVNSIGPVIDQMAAKIVIENCLQASLISSAAADMIKAALSNSVLCSVPVEYREYLRAALLKQLLLTQI